MGTFLRAAFSRRRGLIVIVPFFFSGCMTMPANLLLLPPDYLSTRQQQMKKYETTDEQKVVQAAAGALQDLGFTIDRSENQLGLIVSSKNRTAVDAGQAAGALAVDLAAALFGVRTDSYGQTDKEQRIEAAMIINPSLAEKSIIVRVKFQRIIWNQMGQVSRFETVKDTNLYQGFFERLSKAVFLEEHKL